MNPNPWQAREALARRRARKTGSLTEARKKLWQGIVEAERLLMQPDSGPEIILKCTHALATSVGSYMKLLDAEELNERVTRLEEQAKRRNGQTP